MLASSFNKSVKLYGYFKAQLNIWDDNYQLYHIMIIDLCDTIIILSILLHITILTGNQLCTGQLATQYHIAQNIGGIKLWRIGHFRVLARKTLVSLQQLPLVTMVNLEFGWVKYWQMTIVLPNSPKFSPSKVFHYTVQHCYNYGIKVYMVAIAQSKLFSCTAKDKLALLISNSKYHQLKSLRCPKNDVKILTERLRHLNFKTISLVDLTLSQTTNAVDYFCSLLDKGMYTVFYYSGHGVEVNKTTYFVPIDADEDLKVVQLNNSDLITSKLQSTFAKVIMVLNCCREK